MRPTLALSMIVKNVAPFIKNCLDSALPFVDEVIIVDTGSTDDTKSVIAEVFRTPQLAHPVHGEILDYNATTHPQAFVVDTKENWPEVLGPFTGNPMLVDFGSARQYGWERCQSDYTLWLDSDDVLVDGDKLAEILADMAANNVDMAMLTYDYGVDHLGNVTCRLSRERIAKRGAGARWNLPIHEIMGPYHSARGYEQVRVRHRREEYKIAPAVAHRNLKALLHWWKDKDPKDEKNDPRMLYYLARDEIGIWPDRAVEHFHEYCRRSGWDEERALAHMAVGKYYEERAPTPRREDHPSDEAYTKACSAAKMDDYEKAFGSYALAAAEAGFKPDAFFGLARIAYYKKDWGKCIEWTQKGFAVFKDTDKRPGVLPHDPLDYEYRPHVYYSVALINSGQLQAALDACNAGLKLNPADPHLKGNKEFCEGKLAEEAKPQEYAVVGALRRGEALNAPSTHVPQDVATLVAINLWKKQIEAGRAAQALALLDALPPDAIDVGRIAEARALTEAKLEGRARFAITIWTGWAWEKWTPRSIDTTGIGGSETAATHMARELTRLGHDVTVVADCPGAESYDGVKYIPFRDVTEGRTKLSGDVCIVSRQAEARMYMNDFGQRHLWVHDIHVGTSPDLKNILPQYNCIFALSNWHKQFLLETYPYLPADQIVVTRNGIDRKRFEAEPIKEGNRLIYSSSWDRGLVRLLELLPRVRKEVPDVKLHIYYGATLWKNLRPDQREQVEMLEAAVAIGEREGYIFDHGRVDQQELAKAFLASKVWLYPTWFTETHCVTAIEAQAAGCVPVTTALAALPETVRAGVLVAPPCTTAAAGNEYVSQTVRLLKNEDDRRTLADDGRKHALQNCGWDQVAAEWHTLFLKTRGGVAVHGAAGDPSTVGTTASSETEPSPLRELRIETLARQHRVAVMMGRVSAAIHGVYNVDTLFDEGFLTGTGSNFFNIAWGLAERNHQVDVFCQAEKRFVGAPKLAGANVYNIDEPGLVIDSTYDAYIAINEPDLLRQAPPTALRVCAMWLNDWSYTQAGFDEFVDLYACPSWTHARYIHETTGIAREKLTVIPLATNTEFFTQAIARDPHRAVWISSPDRGLHHLLDIWPDIRENVPDAALDVYYRFQPWYDFMMTDPRQRGNEMHRRAKLLGEQFVRLGRAGENGVRLLGPRPVKEIATALCSARALVYPCDPVRFTEGFSVSILDACAAGCVPIVASVDALPEVYSGTAYLIEGHPAQHQDAWTGAVLRTFSDSNFADTIAGAGRAFAARHTRQVMAARWERLIEERRKT